MCLETQTISYSHLFSLFHFSLKGSFYNMTTQFRKWAKLISHMSLWETECWVSQWGREGWKLTEKERKKEREQSFSEVVKDREGVTKRPEGLKSETVLGKAEVNQLMGVRETSHHLSVMLLLPKVSSSALFVPQRFTIQGNSHVDSWQPSDKVEVLPANCEQSRGNYCRDGNTRPGSSEVWQGFSIKTAVFSFCDKWADTIQGLI